MASRQEVQSAETELGFVEVFLGSQGFAEVYMAALCRDHEGSVRLWSAGTNA